MEADDPVLLMHAGMPTRGEDTGHRRRPRLRDRETDGRLARGQ